ncbi:MAG: YwiC-like family protein [Bacillota bacterium]
MWIRIGPPPLPREHGAWAMLLTPPIVAMIAQGIHPDAVLAMIGWFAAYSMRGPVEVLIGRGASGRAGMAQAERPVARFWLLLLGGLTALLLGLAALAQPVVLLLLTGAGALLGAVWRLAWQGESRSLAAGFLAVTGLMAGAPLYYLTALGTIPPEGWALTYGCFAFFGGSVLRVKALARERRSAAFRWLSLTVHLLLVLVAAGAAWRGWTSPLLAVALLPAGAWAAYGAWRGGRGTPVNLGSVGKAEIWLTLLFALLLILSVRI